VIPVCLYLQVHQPWRLNRYDYFDVGGGRGYFDDAANREIARRVAERSYVPTARMLARLLDRHPEFAVALSFSVCVLDQLASFAPDCLEAFRELSSRGRVEILAETSHHSLLSVFPSPEAREELADQVTLHGRKIHELFGRQPRIFRNTELIYSDAVARFAEDAGFAAILADGVRPLAEPGTADARRVRRAATPGGLPVMLRDYRMSDDIAFRFSDHSSVEHPLSADKYSAWVAGAEGDVLPLFMDFETFGEHQREETGIFEFFEEWVDRHVASGGVFVTPSDAVEAGRARLNAGPPVVSPDFLSWADEERDLSAWQGNELQRDALDGLLALQGRVRAWAASGSPEGCALLETYRRLTTSDHFYYMATKGRADSTVHEYFSPWETPYDAYMAYRHVLADVDGRLPTAESLGRRDASSPASVRHNGSRRRASARDRVHVAAREIPT